MKHLLGELNMPIPDYQSLMLPVLREANQGEYRLSVIMQSLSTKLALARTFYLRHPSPQKSLESFF